MILNAFLIAYRLLWFIGLPFVLLYIWSRGRRDPAYKAHLGERFGIYPSLLPPNPIWIHAVSLGEVRSAVALIRLALDLGDNVVVTHFTPAGRAETNRQFAPEIASGQLAAIWVPFDMHWCFRRFFRACRPRIGLTMEVEFWPAMIFASRRARVPLYMCNAQYASRPRERDSQGLRLRQRVIQGFAGGFVKSKLQADSFTSIGVQNITVTGELRFDQPIAPHLIRAAETLKPTLPEGREVITIASGVESEEPLYADMITRLIADAKAQNRPAPYFVYVPRAPERFDAVFAGLQDAGLTCLRRSTALDDQLNPTASLAETDVFLGDSLGEMFFYLGLADRVVVGSGFDPKGAHNIIEPLMMSKPALTGPHIWTIEFPFIEAEAAGVAKRVPDIDALIAELSTPAPDKSAEIAAFLAEHQGASARTLAEIDKVLGR